MFILLMQRDIFISTISPGDKKAIARAESEDYQSIYFRENKIGYVATTIVPSQGDRIHVTQNGFMRLNVAGTQQNIELHLDAFTFANNEIDNFSFSFRSPFYQMDATGKTDGNTLNYELKTTSSTISDSVTFPSPPLLPTSNRAYLLEQQMEIGDKRRIPWFDPVSMTGKDSIIEYRGLESELIGGRVLKLHKFIEAFGGARVSFWVNDSGSVVKEQSPAGFVFIREPKFRALAMQESSDELLSAVSIKVEGTLPSEEDSVYRYRLHFPAESDLDLISDRQRFDQNILTVTREDLPNNVGFPVCEGGMEALAPSPYIQSDAAEIKELAANLTEDAANPIQKVQVLSDWIYRNLEKRSVIGLPDALTTLKSRQGDCNEHASLFAAMARAAGIPTRILAGVTGSKGAFYYHAWNEVCLGSQWVSVDTTLNQIPADVTHLQFIQGDLSEQIRLSALLGSLVIEPIPPETEQGRP